MMNPFHTEPRMPWYGYVLANFVVWVFVGVIFWGTKSAWFSATKDSVDRPGVMSLMIFIPIAFFIASLYDFFFDRYRSSSGDMMDDEDGESAEDEVIPTARDSRDSGKTKK